MAIAKRKTPTAARHWSRPWDHLFQDFDRLWGQGLTAREPAAGFIPKINAIEKRGKLIVEAEIPGVDKDDIEITVEENDLIVQGESKHESEQEEEGYLRRERSSGFFFRRIPLSFKPDPAEIKANYKSGVLKITMPIPKEGATSSTKVQIS